MEKINATGGTTAVVAYFKDNQLFIANVGDSRAVMCLGGKATRVTTDHKPDLESEKTRIEKLGGWVKNGAITGSITVSRSLGDFPYKPFITCEPDVFGPFSFMEEEYQFLILACDGLWDVVSDQEAVEIALTAKNPEDAAVKLRDQAISSKSHDNVSVLVINFPQYQNEILSPLPELATRTGTMKKRTKNEEKKGEKNHESAESSTHNSHNSVKKSTSKNQRIKKKRQIEKDVNCRIINRQENSTCIKIRCRRKAQKTKQRSSKNHR
jgi:serine/threonine protein phosphatase PrpC